MLVQGSLISSASLVHRQHALRDDEPAEDIDRSEDDGEEAQRRGEGEAGGAPVAISAPTMMTEDTALVTLISGECSAGVTRHTT